MLRAVALGSWQEERPDAVAVFRLDPVGIEMDWQRQRPMKLA